MLKEEKAVRDWKNAAGVNSRIFMREVTALVRAVREDCAFRVRCASAGEFTIEVGVAEHAIIHHYGYKKEDDPKYTAAIRGEG